MRVLDASVVTDALAVSGPTGDQARRLVAAETRRAWELRGNITTYDAWYVALAEALQAPLITSDERLQQVPGPRCSVLSPEQALADD
jgi:predicted nucleic acid-binding protein